MSNVKLVTDSTAYLPADLVAAHDISVVPVEVVIGGKAYRDGVDISANQVAQALADWQPVSTSRPSPAQFAQAYENAAAAGATGVVSVHLSSSLSGTYESALLAARSVDIPVTIVDSETIAMGMGFAVLAGAKAAARGAELDEVEATVVDSAARTSVLFYVDTLEFLRRGGRIGRAAAMFGTALRVKPILVVQDGVVAPLEKTRTTNKALARLADIVAEKVGELGGTAHLAVQHLAAAERADQLVDLLRTRTGIQDILMGEVGAVVGAHVGPGMVAVSVSPRS